MSGLVSTQQWLDFNIANPQDASQELFTQVNVIVQSYQDLLTSGVESFGFNEGGLGNLNLFNVITYSDLSGATVIDNWFNVNISFNNAFRDNYPNLQIPTKYECCYDPSYYFFKLSYFYQHLFRLQTLQTICQNQNIFYANSYDNLAVRFDFVQTVNSLYSSYDVVKSIVDISTGLYKYRIFEGEKPTCIHHVKRIDSLGNVSSNCDLSFYEFLEVASCVQISWSNNGQCVLGQYYKVAINQPSNYEGNYLFNIPFLPFNNNVYQILNVSDLNNIYYQKPSVYTWNNLLTFLALMFFSFTIFDLLYFIKNGNILLPYLEF